MRLLSDPTTLGSAALLSLAGTGAAVAAHSHYKKKKAQPLVPVPVAAPITAPMAAPMPAPMAAPIPAPMAVPEPVPVPVPISMPLPMRAEYEEKINECQTDRTRLIGQLKRLNVTPLTSLPPLHVIDEIKQRWVHVATSIRPALIAFNYVTGTRPARGENRQEHERAKKEQVDKVKFAFLQDLNVTCSRLNLDCTTRKKTFLDKNEAAKYIQLNQWIGSLSDEDVGNPVKINNRIDELVTGLTEDMNFVLKNEPKARLLTDVNLPDGDIFQQSESRLKKLVLDRALDPDKLVKLLANTGVLNDNVDGKPVAERLVTRHNQLSILKLETLRPALPVLRSFQLTPTSLNKFELEAIYSKVFKLSLTDSKTDEWKQDTLNALNNQFILIENLSRPRNIQEEHRVESDNKTKLLAVFAQIFSPEKAEDIINSNEKWWKTSSSGVVNENLTNKVYDDSLRLEVLDEKDVDFLQNELNRALQAEEEKRRVETERQQGLSLEEWSDENVERNKQDSDDLKEYFGELGQQVSVQSLKDALKTHFKKMPSTHTLVKDFNTLTSFLSLLNDQTLSLIRIITSTNTLSTKDCDSLIRNMLRPNLFTEKELRALFVRLSSNECTSLKTSLRENIIDANGTFLKPKNKVWGEWDKIRALLDTYNLKPLANLNKRAPAPKPMAQQVPLRRAPFGLKEALFQRVKTQQEEGSENAVPAPAPAPAPEPKTKTRTTDKSETKSNVGVREDVQPRHAPPSFLSQLQTRAKIEGGVKQEPSKTLELAIKLASKDKKDASQKSSKPSKVGITGAVVSGLTILTLAKMLATADATGIKSTQRGLHPAPTKVITSQPPTPVITSLEPNPTPVITSLAPTKVITSPAPTPVITSLEPNPTPVITSLAPTKVITSQAPTPVITSLEPNPTSVKTSQSSTTVITSPEPTLVKTSPEPTPVKNYPAHVPTSSLQSKTPLKPNLKSPPWPQFHYNLHRKSGTRKSRSERLERRQPR